MGTTTITKNRSVTLESKTEVMNVLGKWSQPSPTSKLRYAFTDYVEKGDNYPDWQRRIRAGECATTYLKGEKVTYSVSDGVVEIEVSPNSYGCTGGIRRQRDSGFFGILPIPASPSGISISSADAAALASYVRDIREKQTAFSAPTFAGEMAETIRMIRHPIRSITTRVERSVPKLRKLRKIKSQSRRRAALSDFWLSLQFGWTPLFRDISDIMDAITYRYQQPSDLIKVKGVASVETPNSEIYDFYLSGLNASSVYQGIRSTSKVTVVYTGRLKRSPSFDRAIDGQYWGLDLSNWAPTAWELLPWSFLIDYFTNIGDVISALTLNESMLAWTQRTVIQERQGIIVGQKHILSQNGCPGTWKSLRLWVPSQGKVTRRIVTRDVYNESLVPNLKFDIPHRWQQVANIVALARTRTRDLLPFF